MVKKQKIDIKHLFRVILVSEILIVEVIKVPLKRDTSTFYGWLKIVQSSKSKLFHGKVKRSNISILMI